MRAISITYALGVTALALSACSNQGASERGDKTSVLAGRVEAGPVNYEVQTLAEGLCKAYGHIMRSDDELRIGDHGHHIGAKACDDQSPNPANKTHILSPVS